MTLNELTFSITYLLLLSAYGLHCFDKPNLDLCLCVSLKLNNLEIFVLYLVNEEIQTQLHNTTV